MTFRNESQLRKAWDITTKSRTFWVEPAIGSTFGIPDAFNFDPTRPGVAIFTEMKCGDVGADGFLRYRVRTSQRNVIPQMIEDGASVLVAVAQAGRGIVHVMPADLLPEFVVLRGKVRLVDLMHAAEIEAERTGSENILKSWEDGKVGATSISWAAYGPRAFEWLKNIGMKTPPPPPKPRRLAVPKG